jgi:hypothetical protein
MAAKPKAKAPPAGTQSDPDQPQATSTPKSGLISDRTRSKTQGIPYPPYLEPTVQPTPHEDVEQLEETAREAGNFFQIRSPTHHRLAKVVQTYWNDRRLRFSFHTLHDYHGRGG